MGTPTPPPRRALAREGAAPGVAVRDVLGGLAAGVVLAVSQPILDLLAGDLAFFTAHQARAADIVVLALVLTVVVPLLVALPVAGLVRWVPAAGIWLFAVVVAVLAAIVGQRLLGRVAPLPATALVAASLLAGAVVAAACLRAAAVRTLLRWGMLGPPLVLALFLLASPASRLVVSPAAATAAEAPGIGNPVPVAVLVLDELPVVSLLDAAGGIDRSRFPGFARLAEAATWYRNTATVHHNTDQVVPAVLSGQLPRPDVEPSFAGYPDTLFSMVGEAYDVWAHEEVTWLCPPDVCEAQTRPEPSPRQRWQRLLADTAVIGAHVAVPEPARDRLPPVDTAWAGFAGAGAEPAGSAAPSGEDERVGFDDLLASLDTWGGPSLRYFHHMAPHHPWTHLPDGVVYPGDVGIPEEGPTWGPDEVVVQQAQQRHLLQTGHVDSQVGDLLDRLQASDAYDEALVVVMADHGIGFTPGGAFRGATPDNAIEVGFVPLFVKYPGQREGRVDDRPASLRDVLPTIADVLDAEPAWPMVGISLRRPGPTGPRERVLHGAEPVALPAVPDFADVLARNADRFGRGAGWDPVYRTGPYADLLDADVGALAAAPDPGHVTLVDPHRFEAVDPATGVLPALVRGTVSSAAAPAGTWLAVAVNGRVAATTRVREAPDGSGFSALAVPEAFRAGSNAVRVHRIEDTAGGPVLHALEVR